MTVIEGENDGGNRSGGATIASLNLASTYPCKPLNGEGIRWLLFALDFAWRAIWIPAFAGMTVIEGGNDGGNRSGGAVIVPLNLASTYPCKHMKGEGIRCPRFCGDDAVEIHA